MTLYFSIAANAVERKRRANNNMLMNGRIYKKKFVLQSDTQRNKAVDLKFPNENEIFHILQIVRTEFYRFYNTFTNLLPLFLYMLRFDVFFFNFRLVGFSSKNQTEF